MINVECFWRGGWKDEESILLLYCAACDTFYSTASSPLLI